MKLSPRLALRQTQALVMTPQLQQAIKLLQLSNLEVVAFVEQELEQNPLLAREGENEDAAAEAGDAREGFDMARTDGEARGVDPTPSAPSLLDPVADDGAGESGSMPASEAGVEAEGDDWHIGAASAWRSGGRSDFAGADGGHGVTASRPKTLREHLLEQVNIDIGDPADRIIAVHLVNQLDPTGYLPPDLASVADALNCPPARIDAMLERLQQFDPPGVFARSLRECLAIQLRERDRFDPAMAKMIEHLDLLARRELTTLARLCGVDRADLADMIAEVKSLDPKPGEVFDEGPAPPVIPDVLLRSAPGGGWLVELNPDTLPRVLVDQRYHARISRQKLTKPEREFVAEKLQSANWLVKSLHQRAQTILKVASEIVRQQDAFFRRGVQHLRPLVLRDIADAISMHESTVSRVTSNKYLAAPQGIYELKYFFTSAIASVDGAAAHSSEAVRSRIRALIQSERPMEVLSDDRIVDALRGEGVDIARRTVAKYREAMRIPSSVRRRRDKLFGF